MRVRERILAKFWRASRAEFNSRARSLYGIGADHHLGLIEASRMRVIRWAADTSPLFCFRYKRVDRGFLFVHEAYLVAVDLASHVGTIHTWLASYFLV